MIFFNNQFYLKMSIQEQTKTIIEDSIASPYMDTFNMSNLILSYCLNENANTRFYIYILI